MGDVVAIVEWSDKVDPNICADSRCCYNRWL